MAIGVLNVHIRFKLGERALTLQYRKVPFQAWAELKQATSFTQKTLVSALVDVDLDAIVAVIWLERKQRERKLRYIDVYQDLQADEGDTEDGPQFEVEDIIVDGRSISGERVTPREDEDPTAGS